MATRTPKQQTMPSLEKAVQKRRRGSMGGRFTRALRYPRLLQHQWQHLPHALKRRFIKTTSPGQIVIFKGRIHKTRLSKLGWAVAKLAKIVGGPLPESNKNQGHATVIVQESPDQTGQIWTRIFPSHKEMPHISQSKKEFQGPTGLQEIITPHLGMTLKVKLVQKSLQFQSEVYFLKIKNHHVALPWFLTPGTLIVTHRETSPKRFRYTLRLVHPLLGELIYQTGLFEEVLQW